MLGAQSLVSLPLQIGRRATIEGRSAVHAWQSGVLRLDPPWRTLAIVRAVGRLGQIGGAITAGALRYGERVALLDELGPLTYAELDSRSSALASALGDRGVCEEDCVGILCRNHRGFIDITFAAAKLGARMLYLNTDFAGPQLRDVCEREDVSLLVHDDEYDGLVDMVAPRHGHVRAWTEGEGDGETLERLISQNTGRVPPTPREQASIVLLTSGTTGTPRGAPRHAGASLHPLGALLSKVPFRAGQSTYVAAPIFHGLGFTQMALAMILGCTVIVERRFRPERVLDSIAERRPTGLVVVPVMLQRIVGLLEAEPGRWDTSSLRIIFASGSQLDAELVRRTQRTIGDVLYNFYGSTEVAWATFATPEDLRAAPGCAGRPPYGTVVRLYDDSGRRVAGPGRVGRIFVGNNFQFDGYTGGGGKEVIDGVMSTGDVGHFDDGGRLFVDGRDDEMIVSGGENLFPSEVEELLLAHEGVEEAAVVGVDDEEFGKRLAAFVVSKRGATPSEDELKDFVRRNLARYKVPREVTFIEELPRNPTGKVLKRELRARAASEAAGAVDSA